MEPPQLQVQVVHLLLLLLKPRVGLVHLGGDLGDGVAHARDEPEHAGSAEGRCARGPRKLRLQLEKLSEVRVHAERRVLGRALQEALQGRPPPLHKVLRGHPLVLGHLDLGHAENALLRHGRNDAPQVEVLLHQLLVEAQEVAEAPAHGHLALAEVAQVGTRHHPIAHKGPHALPNLLGFTHADLQQLLWLLLLFTPCLGLGTCIRGKEGGGPPGRVGGRGRQLLVRAPELQLGRAQQGGLRLGLVLVQVHLFHGRTLHRPWGRTRGVLAVCSGKGSLHEPLASILHTFATTASVRLCLYQTVQAFFYPSATTLSTISFIHLQPYPLALLSVCYSIPQRHPTLVGQHRCGTHIKKQTPSLPSKATIHHSKCHLDAMIKTLHIKTCVFYGVVHCSYYNSHFQNRTWTVPQLS
uniref:Putative secreted protein n=1 Tax=Ixodes ricinus TaxID=34613 RepID=A0A147BEZ8_IXORI